MRFITTRFYSKSNEDQVMSGEQIIQIRAIIAGKLDTGLSSCRVGRSPKYELGGLAGIKTMLEILVEDQDNLLSEVQAAIDTLFTAEMELIRNGVA